MDFFRYPWGVAAPMQVEVQSLGNDEAAFDIGILILKGVNVLYLPFFVNLSGRKYPRILIGRMKICGAIVNKPGVRSLRKLRLYLVTTCRTNRMKEPTLLWSLVRGGNHSGGDVYSGSNEAFWGFCPTRDTSDKPSLCFRVPGLDPTSLCLLGLSTLGHIGSCIRLSYGLRLDWYLNQLYDGENHGPHILLMYHLLGDRVVWGSLSFRILESLESLTDIPPTCVPDLCWQMENSGYRQLIQNYSTTVSPVEETQKVELGDNRKFPELLNVDRQNTSRGNNARKKLELRKIEVQSAHDCSGCLSGRFITVLMKMQQFRPRVTGLVNRYYYMLSKPRKEDVIPLGRSRELWRDAARAISISRGYHEQWPFCWSPNARYCPGNDGLLAGAMLHIVWPSCGSAQAYSGAALGEYIRAGVGCGQPTCDLCPMFRRFSARPARIQFAVSAAGLVVDGRILLTLPSVPSQACQNGYPCLRAYQSNSPRRMGSCALRVLSRRPHGASSPLESISPFSLCLQYPCLGYSVASQRSGIMAILAFSSLILHFICSSCLPALPCPTEPLLEGLAISMITGCGRSVTLRAQHRLAESLSQVKPPAVVLFLTEQGAMTRPITSALLGRHRVAGRGRVAVCVASCYAEFWTERPDPCAVIAVTRICRIRTPLRAVRVSHRVLTFVSPPVLSDIAAAEGRLSGLSSVMHCGFRAGAGARFKSQTW
ncbi:hypothetical protein Tco_0461497 [Tanacetum coccineum]